MVKVPSVIAKKLAFSVMDIPVEFILLASFFPASLIFARKARSLPMDWVAWIMMYPEENC